MQLLGSLPPGATANVTPTWDWECTFGQACQAGAANLSGGAAIANDHLNYLSPPGFVAGLSATGADASWQVLGAPAGTADVTIRYSNYTGGDGNLEPRTESLVVNGTTTQVTLPTTAELGRLVHRHRTGHPDRGHQHRRAGLRERQQLQRQHRRHRGHRARRDRAPFLPAAPRRLHPLLRLGQRHLLRLPACATLGATCTANIPQMAPGLLDQSGWYLLDDSQTAVWTSDGWIANRPAGDIQDGYLFGYGQNYTGALSDLAKLTGPAPLLPESTFGTWFSQYDPYSTADYQGTILPQFPANGVSLDNLSVDTDWKSPSTWDGWEWNPTLFPDPTAFEDWAASDGKAAQKDVLAMLQPLLTGDASDDCAKKLGKPNATARIANGGKIETREFFVSRGLVRVKAGPTAQCFSVTGEGLIYLPMHRSWLIGPYKESITFKSPLTVTTNGHVMADLSQKNGEWVDNQPKTRLDWDFFDKFQQSLKDYKVQYRVLKEAAKDKPWSSLQLGSGRYVFFKIGPKLWAIQRPGNNWLDASGDWSFWFDLDDAVWQDRHWPVIEKIEAAGATEEEKLAAMTELDSGWSRTLEDFYQRRLLDKAEDSKIRAHALERMRTKPSWRNIAAEMEFIQAQPSDEMLRDATQALHIRNPKGQIYTPGTDRTPVIKEWTDWWQKNNNRKD